MNQGLQSSSGNVLAARQGGLGLITLNRPEAMNALSLDMVRAITEALLRWLGDPSISVVLLKGNNREGRPPAFCAGGDIRFIRRALLDGDPRLDDFFTEEYQLDHLIHHYPKPVVAWMDGVVMGGGMGLAQGAAVRVVTEHSQLAMPETVIGLFPDAGGGYYLSRCPGRIGEFLALTGQVLGPGDAIALGLADRFVPADRLSKLISNLSERGTCSVEITQAIVQADSLEPPAPEVVQYRDAIDQCFSMPRLLEIIQSLESQASQWSTRVTSNLRCCSPLMLAVALEQVRRARRLELEDELRMERTLIRQSLTARGDIPPQAMEGIRALAIDKDRQPHWDPVRIEDVTASMVDSYFMSPWPPQAHPLRHFLV